MTTETTSPASDEGHQTSVAQKALTPISASSRIETMDILRGFALIGIALMNVEWFNRTINNLGQWDFSLTGADWGAGWMVRMFVEGKFYKLFSILFGMGFAVMLIRAQEAGRPFYGWFTRRMVFLFLFGMAHMVFLWGGDILHDYAAGGLMLLLWIWIINKFQRLSFLNQPRWFLRIGLGVLALPFVFSFFAALFFGVTRYESVMLKDNEERIAVRARAEEIKADPVLSAKLIAEYEAEKNDPEGKAEDEEEEDKKEEEMTDEEKIEDRAQNRFKNQHRRKENQAEEETAFTQPSFWVATEYRTKEALDALKNTPFFAGIISFPLFMVGYWFVASGVMRRPKEHVGLFKTMMWVGFGVGMFVTAGSLLLMVNPAQKFAVELNAVANMNFMLGQYLMCAGYIGAFALICMTARGMKWFAWCAPMGRMALTNYIMHSVILTSIFYGYAGGMFGEISRAPQVGIIAGIILFQAIFSKIWLNHFKFGPLEWLWRSLTYMSVQPMRREKQTEAQENKPAAV